MSLSVPALTCGFVHSKERLSDLSHMSPWFQTTPVIVCLQNGVPSIRITSLYGFQPSSVVFGCKTATLEQDNKYLWVPDMKCPFVHAKQRD